MTENTFEMLFDAHMKRLWALAFRLCGKREDAEDLLQDAAISAFRAFDHFERGSNFGAWMSAILLNSHRNRARFEARRIQAVPLESAENENAGEGDAGENWLYQQTRARWKSQRSENPEQRLFDALDGALVSEAFGALPDDFRECCALFWIAQLSYEEIALALGVPLGTVRSRLFRGRRLLQRALWSLALERGLVRGEPESPKKPGTKDGKMNLLLWVFGTGSALFHAWNAGTP